MVLFKFLIVDQFARQLLDLPNSIVTNQYKYEVNAWIDNAEMDHVEILFKNIHVPVEANIV